MLRDCPNYDTSPPSSDCSRRGPHKPDPERTLTREHDRYLLLAEDRERPSTSLAVLKYLRDRFAVDFGPLHGHPVAFAHRARKDQTITGDHGSSSKKPMNEPSFPNLTPLPPESHTFVTRTSTSVLP